MKLTLEQFETQWTESNLSTTDWFDTTYGLFKELEALQSRSCEGCKYGYIGRKRCTHTDMFFFYEYSIYMDIDFCCNRYEPKEQQ